MGGNTCPQGQYMSGGMCVSNSNGGGGYRRGGKVNPRRRMAKGGRTIRRTTRNRKR